MPDPSRLSQRFDRIRAPIIAELDRTSNDLLRSGKPIIDLSTGFIPGEMAHSLRQVAADSWRDDHVNYLSGRGLPSLRDAVIGWLDVRDFRSGDDVLVSSSPRAALSAILTVIAGLGEPVLVDRAAWMVFHHTVAVSGATPIPCSPGLASPRGLDAARHLKLTAADVAMALDMMPGARAILLANPVNPTAQVYDSDEIHGIIDVCAANRVFCIIDRLYATLIYDGARFPWLQPDPAVREWCILVDGVARAFRGLGGLKIGWACGPRDVIEAAGIAQDCASGPAGRVEQRVALAALDSPFDLGVLEELQMARDVFLERVRAVKDIEAWPVAGTMYCILDFRRFIGRTTPVGWILESSGDIADFLLREAGVLVTPGDSVGLPGLVRVSFASPLDEITVAVSAIEYALSLLTPV